MGKEKETGLSEKQARAIRAVLSAPDTDLNKVMGLLANDASGQTCDTDKFCAEVQKELITSYSTVVGRPQLLRDPILGPMMGKITDLLRGWNTIAFNK